jgi:hypothetical protein
MKDGDGQIYEVIYIKQGKEPRFKYIKYMNLGLNKLPVPYKTVNIHEFRFKFANYTPSYVEHRHVEIKGRILSAKIFYFHDVAFAMVFDKSRHKNKDKKMVYDKPILYYRIGCEHKYKELSKEVCTKRNLVHFGTCWHVYECVTCGMIDTKDSSG